MSVKQVIKGSTKSWTMWFAVALTAFGALQLELDHFSILLSPKVNAILNIVTGVIVAILRMVTTTSLAEKADASS